MLLSTCLLIYCLFPPLFFSCVIDSTVQTHDETQPVAGHDSHRLLAPPCPMTIVFNSSAPIVLSFSQEEFRGLSLSPVVWRLVSIDIDHLSSAGPTKEVAQSITLSLARRRATAICYILCSRAARALSAPPDPACENCGRRGPARTKTFYLISIWFLTMFVCRETHRVMT